jgi:hypothetical protein
MRALLLAALLWAGNSFAQTCPVAPSSPVPRDQARITWQRPTHNTDGSTIPASTVFTYTLYRRTGSTDTAVCTTNGELAGQTGLAVGTHTWVVTARAGSGPESGKSAPGSKTVDAPPVPTPNPPGGITVASTRIDPDSWTCRDENGAILSRHERQDKAQESCTNFAIASLGKPYEMRPSGFRIVAR